MERLRPSNQGIERPDTSRIKHGEMITRVILEKRLPLYLKTASETGLKVEKIAGVGEKYLATRMYLATTHNRRMLIPSAVSAVVGRKGYVAVSIEKPESADSFAPYWRKLKSLKQEEA